MNYGLGYFTGSSYAGIIIGTNIKCKIKFNTFSELISYIKKNSIEIRGWLFEDLHNMPRTIFSCYFNFSTLGEKSCSSYSGFGSGSPAYTNQEIEEIYKLFQSFNSTLGIENAKSKYKKIYK